MNGDDSVQILWGIGALALVLSSLAARRVSSGAILKAVIGWLLIAALLFALFVNRDRLTLLAEQLGLSDQQVVGDTVRIQQAPDGHFYANARINGTSVRMLIDSGATITALSEATAAAAKIQTSEGFPVMLTTANGLVSARRGQIETFAIGGLETRDLPVVISPNFGNVNVVGMNMLSRLGSWRVEGRTLVLEADKHR